MVKDESGEPFHGRRSIAELIGTSCMVRSGCLQDLRAPGWRGITVSPGCLLAVGALAHVADGLPRHAVTGIRLRLACRLVDAAAVWKSVI